MNERVGAGVGTQGGGDYQPEVLHQLSVLPAGRHWAVDDSVRKFKEAMEVRMLLSGAALEREVRWFEQFEYSRAICQLHVEQVMDLRLKERKEIYKRWRADLGDAQARRYAKFAEYVIQNGRPQWFKKSLTQFPDTIVLRPSSVSTDLPVSWSPSQRERIAA